MMKALVLSLMLALPLPGFSATISEMTDQFVVGSVSAEQLTEAMVNPSGGKEFYSNLETVLNRILNSNFGNGALKMMRLKELEPAVVAREQELANKNGDIMRTHLPILGGLAGFALTLYLSPVPETADHITATFYGLGGAFQALLGGLAGGVLAWASADVAAKVLIWEKPAQPGRAREIVGTACDKLLSS